MTDIKIHNPVQTEFAMVPNVLWTWPGLSFKAKAFMAYLLSFRHGVCPPVAAMEAESGLGRDARKSVMRELEAAGLARWIVQRDASARIVAKYLEVTTLPLLAAAVARAQAVAESHTPENPSDGKSGAVRLVSRRAAAENPAILKRKEIDKGRDARKSLLLSPRPAPVRAVVASAPLALSPFQRSRVWSGQSVLLDGLTVLPGSPDFEALRQALRAQDAENEGRLL
jgi:hypothetical protein